MWGRGTTIALAVVAGLASCEDSVVVNPVDAGSDAAAEAGTPDASLVDGPCDPSKPFDTPTEGPFVALNPSKPTPLLGTSIASGYARSDELELFFVTSTRTAASTVSAIAVATRSSPDASFATEAGGFPYNSVSLLPQHADYAPVVTPDGLTLYYAAGDQTDLVTVLAMTVRTDRSSPWQAPVRTNLHMFPVDWVNGELWLLPTDARLGRLVYRATVSDGGTSQPVVVSELGAVDRVVLSNGGTRAFVGKGGRVFTTTRADAASTFGPLEPVPSLDGAWTIPTWVSSDGCRIVLASSRSTSTNPSSASKLFLAVRPR